MNPDDLFIQRRLSGISRQLTGIVKNLEEFGQEHPHVIAPNILAAMVGNLKDDINILLREVNYLGSPDRQALRDRRYVCRSCQRVFAAPLAAGICDECRGRGITTSELPARTEEPEALSPAAGATEEDPFASEGDEGEKAPPGEPEDQH
jgi:hypothetical protein